MEHNELSIHFHPFLYVVITASIQYFKQDGVWGKSQVTLQTQFVKYQNHV